MGKAPLGQAPPPVGSSAATNPTQALSPTLHAGTISAPRGVALASMPAPSLVTATPMFVPPGHSASLPVGTATMPTMVLPRFAISLFDGSDPIAWLAQAEQFFLVHDTPIRDRVAMFWAQWALRRTTSITWAQFSHELIEHFGDSSVINAYEAMHATR
ncbi:hypothetical protein ACS0TY_025024 [Phlomoides rotata]